MSLLLVVAITVALVFATIAAGLFSALESAIASMREYHVSALVRRNPGLAEIIERIGKRPRRSLNQVILILCILHLLIASLALWLIRESQLFPASQTWLPPLLLFGAIIIFGDLIPKILALANPSRVFEIGLTVFRKIERITLSPADRLTELGEKFGRTMLKPESTERISGFSDEEIEALVKLRQEEGILTSSESGIIQDVIRLGNKTAKDCMTPRVDAFLLPISSTAEEVRATAKQRKRWKAVIYDDSPDVIIGVLDIKQWLREGSHLEFSNLVVPPIFVPETMLALDVFREHLAIPRSLVIVTDEYGGVDGVLTHSNIIEAILADEAPLAGVPHEIRTLPDGVLQVAGDARLEEIEDHLSGATHLHRDGLDTIGGLIFNELGHVPLPGTLITVAPGISAIVRQNRGNRIVEVLVRQEEIA